MKEKKISIFFTKRQRELILKYGLPFDNIRRQLQENRNKRGNVKISDGAYWWEQMAGDLATSLNEDDNVPNDGTYEQVEEIYEIVEMELRHLREDKETIKGKVRKIII